MLVSKKIRLILTPDQEKYVWQAAGTARWAYNRYLERNKQQYESYKNGKTESGYVTAYSFNKEVTQLKKTTEYAWLKTIAAEVSRTAVINAEKAYKAFFEGRTGFPKFKSRRKNRPSFAIQKKSFQYCRHGCRLENMGFVKTSEPLPKRPKGSYKNVTVSYDNKYWYVSFSYEVKEKPIRLSENSIGIDLGVKELAVVYNTDGSYKVYHNINKTTTVRKTEKRLKRKQRAQSCKYQANISGYTDNRKPILRRNLNDCKNYQKNRKQVQRIFRRLRCIRENHIHQTTAEIVKAKPSRIVLEDLNVKGLMKNKHLAKAIADQGWYEFRRQIEYKAQRLGITVVIVPRTYPSSKTCSCCGTIKRDLKLKDRTYRCTECGLIIDRDLNAAINLANYQE